MILKLTPKEMECIKEHSINGRSGTVYKSSFVCDCLNDNKIIFDAIIKESPSVMERLPNGQCSGKAEIPSSIPSDAKNFMFTVTSRYVRRTCIEQ